MVIGLSPLYISYKIFTATGVLIAVGVNLFEFAGGVTLNKYITCVCWVLMMVLAVLFVISGILWIRWGVSLIIGEQV